MTWKPFVRSLFGLSLSLSALSLAGPASAQSEYGETCRPAERCSTSTGACDSGTHPVTLPSGVCICASGPDNRFGVPTLCCGDSGCPSGSTCRNVDGSDADLCATSELNLCTGAGDVLTLEQAHACFTPPGTADVQAYWRAGDCDGDGTANGVEVASGRNPCCNESTDLGCCLAVPDADPAACCVATGAESPGACCVIHGGEPEACCLDEDPVSCCDGTSEPLGCCEAVASGDTTCCVFDEDPAACCLDGDGSVDECCGLAGADDEDACAGLDVGVGEDAGLPDAGITESDAGPNTMDGGTTGADGGTSFGGGGGCVCNAGRRSPSPLALLGLALAITIPVFRRRR